MSLTEDTLVKARVLDGQQWSPLREAQFLREPATDASLLRVAEIHYNPAAPTAEEITAGHDDNNDFEFVELVNPTGQPMDLTDVKLVRTVVDGQQQGIEFDFSAGAITRLDPWQRVLVVEDRAAFGLRYARSCRWPASGLVGWAMVERR